MPAKKARAAIRQEQIARVAMKLLAVRGWQRVSLAAIAKQAGMVTSAVYRHFRGKAEALDAVLDLVDQSFQANLQAAQEATGQPVAQLHEVLVRHVALVVSGVPVPRIVLSEDVFTGRPRHRKRAHNIYRNYLSAIAGIIRARQGQGVICDQWSADTLSVMWLGLVQSPAILWLLGHSDFNLEQHCERAWECFARALQPNCSRRQSRT